MTTCGEDSDALIASVGLTADSYPTGSTGRAEFAFLVATGDTLCIRLYDLTADQAIADSESCATNASGSEGLLVLQRSASFALPGGVDHRITWQASSSSGFGGYVFAARLIIDWP